MFIIKPFSSHFRYSYLLLFILFSCAASEKENSESASDQLAAFIETFNASQGWGDLPEGNDYSAERFELTYAATNAKLIELRNIDTTSLSFDEKIDWEFAQSILAGRALSEGYMKFWKKDPRSYMAFRSIGNIIDGPGESADKLVRLKEKLALVPAQLSNGMKQIETYVPRFQELGLFMAENSSVLFKKDIPEFLNGVEGEEVTELQQLTEESWMALEKFIDYLKEEMPKLPEGDFAVGEEVYNQMLKEQFLLDYDAESLYAFGWEQFRKTQDELTALAKEIDPSKTWQELIIEIKNDYPHPDSMIQAHQYWVDKSRDHILENNLMPIPWQEKVTVVPRAEYLRKTSYYGNFSRAREADENGVFQAQWMINPYEDQWDQETKDQYLVEHDWGVIIVTAPHESYGGHHVQGLYQMHLPSKLRRENGISLFSEGWGLYNEQLMKETGFFPDKRIYLRQLQLRLWRNARVIYDVGLHTKRLNYEEAISLMEDEVGFLRWAAQLEIDSATSRPGYFIGYFLGMYELLQMREEYKALKGDAFSFSDFHVKILEAGNMPTSLIRRVLLEGAK